MNILVCIKQVPASSKVEADPALMNLMAGIKKAFDPKNILNPYKIFQD